MISAKVGHDLNDKMVVVISIICALHSGQA